MSLERKRNEDPPGRPKLLYFYRGEQNSADPLAATLEANGWSVTQVAVSDRAPLWGIGYVLFRRDFSKYDVVAASEYYLSWGLCVRLLLSWKSPKLAALSFNQSRRLLLTGFPPLDRQLNKIWRRVSLFLVHSRHEAALFERIHDIPEDRFVFSHWGFDLPAFDRSKVQSPPRPYVTMVGRNNRDLGTFCAAVERAGVDGVLITAKYMLDRDPVRPSENIRVFADLTMEECLKYVAGSFAHLVLVTDAARGAGHISSVSAMLLGKPQIFSEVAPLSDYLSDGFNGLAVPLRDTNAVAHAIRRLRQDHELCEKLGQNGRSFALADLSYEASAGRIAAALSSLTSPERQSFGPPADAEA